MSRRPRNFERALLWSALVALLASCAGTPPPNPPPRVVGQVGEYVIGVPDLLDKIGDETVATTGEELVEFMMKQGHPALEMEALF